MKLSLITLTQPLETNATMEQLIKEPTPKLKLHLMIHNQLASNDSPSSCKKQTEHMGLQYTLLTPREIKYKTSLILLSDSHRPEDQSSIIANSTRMPPDA